MANDVIINSVESLYKTLCNPYAEKEKAFLMLILRDWFSTVSDFDPVTGGSLHTGVIELIYNVTQIERSVSCGEIKDVIYQIASHTKEAIQSILEHTRDKILREHAMLPIYAVREVDKNSVQWLSRQSGRTLREKLAGKPYIKAVKRRASIDTSENRLFKVFLYRFEQILIERQSALNALTEETCEELLILIQGWLRSENASEIGSWNNTPPNNTLLQDKRYRKVWDGWLWLQGIDEIIENDNRRIEQDILTVIYWKTISLLNNTGYFRIIQQPINIDYVNFNISPSLPINGYLFWTSDLSDKEKCTELIAKETNIPIPIKLNLAYKTIEICLDYKTILVQIENDNIFLIQNHHDIKNKFQINSSILNNVPQTLLSMIVNTNFDLFEAAKNQTNLGKFDTVIIDLCSIRPKFANNTGSQTLLPFRLLQQLWQLSINDTRLVDCGESKAITFHSDIKTISMMSLFSTTSTLTNATKSNASMFFMKKLREYLPAKKISYLVPDWGNDFDLECIRKSVNFYFENSTPLPRSIAAIFSWQSSKRFEQDNIHENDFVLVTDAVGKYVSITPIQAIYHKKLNKILPESKGITWERHPTITVRNENVYNKISQKLSRDGCQVPEDLINLFGFDGLLNDAGELSVVYNDNWYHIPDSIREIMSQNDSFLSNEIISNCMNSINCDLKDRNIFILPLDNTIKKPEKANNYNWLGSAWSPIRGCQTLNKWQEKTDNISLWSDHLPELSIRIVRNGHYEQFYLVKNATVTPQRGRSVSIPVDEVFTLTAGLQNYNFPLQQGEGNRELQFVAYLKSPAFPLKKDTSCKLHMTYTYGADDPYELQFIPIDSSCAEFKSIQVEWRSISENIHTNLANLPTPDFPPRKTWNELQRYPKKEGADFYALLDWLKIEMIKIHDIAKYGRVKAKITKWIDKGDNNIFCFIEETFIHKSWLNLQNTDILPQSGEIVSFYKIRNNINKYSGKDIYIGDIEPKSCFLTESLRFPVLTIWNGHSLSESDVPEQFRNTVFDGIKNAISIIESEEAPESLKKEIFFFLCCLHKDAPNIVSQKLLNAVKVKNDLLSYYRNIAFSIGDAELTWQKELFDYVLKLNNQSIKLKILAIAFWRSKNLIYRLNKAQIDVLNSYLLKHLESDLKLLSSKKVTSKYQTHICNHLELLLALLRTREINDENIKMIFSPNGEITKKYVKLVDEISKSIIDNNIELKTRINLQIEKPDLFKKTPDLLYALQMYLTANSGANTILITSINDDS